MAPSSPRRKPSTTSPSATSPSTPRPENTIADVHAKARAYYALRSDLSYQNLQFACDLWTAAFFQTYQRENIPFLTTETLRTLYPPVHLHSWVAATTYFLPFFHWVLEFPSIMEEGGFDVVLGNPPFLGGPQNLQHPRR
jgi:hypothetical protein